MGKETDLWLTWDDVLAAADRRAVNARRGGRRIRMDDLARLVGMGVVPGLDAFAKPFRNFSVASGQGTKGRRRRLRLGLIVFESGETVPVREFNATVHGDAALVDAIRFLAERRRAVS